MQHVIQRQTIEINTADIKSAKVLQKRMEILFKSQAMPMMDKVLSSFAEADSTIRFEKMELNLGSFSIDELDTHFTESLRTQLNNALQKQIRHLPTTKLDQPKDGEATIQPKEKSDLELLVYYLQRGVLPWWVANNKTFNLAILLDKVLDKKPDELIRKLKEPDSSLAVRRLFLQSTSSVYQSLIHELSPKSDAVMIEAVHDWLTIIKESNLGSRQTANIKIDLLTFLLQSPPQHASAKRLSGTLYESIRVNTALGTEKNSFIAFAKKAQKSLTKTSVVAIWIEQKMQLLISEKTQADSVEKVATSKQTEDEDKLTAESKKRLPNKLKAHLDTLQKGQNKALKPIPKKQTTTQKWQIKEAAYYIENAGIILLWPFLARYFTTLKLLEDKAFVDENAQEKAVLLLQYLATGNTEAEEHTLLLSKLLCGWPLDQPLLRSIEISKRDKQQSKELILAVISHWNVLKNTSTDGLRQSFLQREGRLTEKDHGWELFINRTGFDVLLDQLPWGIGTIHLPWMEKTVFVEW